MLSYFFSSYGPNPILYKTQLWIFFSWKSNPTTRDGEDSGGGGEGGGTSWPQTSTVTCCIRRPQIPQQHMQHVANSATICSRDLSGPQSSWFPPLAWKAHVCAFWAARSELTAWTGRISSPCVVIWNSDTAWGWCRRTVEQQHAVQKARTRGGKEGKRSGAREMQSHLKRTRGSTGKSHLPRVTLPQWRQPNGACWCVSWNLFGD